MSKQAKAVEAVAKRMPKGGGPDLVTLDNVGALLRGSVADYLTKAREAKILELRIGALLMFARQAAHGEFGAFVANYAAGLSKRQVSACMDLAERFATAQGIEIGGAVHMLTGEAKDQRSAEQMAFAWFEEEAKATAKAQGGFAAWLAEHHPKLAGAKARDVAPEIRAEYIEWVKAHQPKPEELAAMERDAAQTYWHRWMMDTREHGEAKDWSHLNAGQRKGLAEIARTLAQDVEKSLRGK